MGTFLTSYKGTLLKSADNVSRAVDFPRIIPYSLGALLDFLAV